MKDEFNERAFALGQEIKKIVDAWRAPLQEAFEQASYTANQEKAIRKRIDIDTDGNTPLSNMLTEAFFASPNNMAVGLFLFEDIENDGLKIVSLRKPYDAFTDIAANLPLLLPGDKMPTGVQDAVKTINDKIIPGLKKMLEEMGVDLDNEDELERHNEHLKALPDSFPEL